MDEHFGDEAVSSDTSTPAQPDEQTALATRRAVRRFIAFEVVSIAIFAGQLTPGLTHTARR